jgi:catechol 2,3-dioxygenase-like lactoylglutathione lyase family enzyme
MIERISHTGVWVLDQDEALDFYVNKLGFQVHTDARTDDFRWVTITPPEQPDLEVMLSVPGPPLMDPQTAEQVRSLIAKGMLGSGIMATSDCRKTWEELKERGVEFTQEPMDTFYGVDAAFRDNSGNPWRLVQPLPDPPREFPKDAGS